MLAGQFLHGQLPSFLMGSSRGSKFEGEDTGTALKQSAPLTRCSAKADLGNLHGKEHDSQGPVWGDSGQLEKAALRRCGVTRSCLRSLKSLVKKDAPAEE